MMLITHVNSISNQWSSHTMWTHNTDSLIFTDTADNNLRVAKALIQVDFMQKMVVISTMAQS